MKKILLGAASLTLLVAAASCTKETVDKPASDNQIEFQSYLGKQSKATELTLGILEDDSDSNNPIAIEAFADNSSTTPWKSFELYHDGAKWTYGIPVVQPDVNLVYYAWYPVGTTALKNTSNFSSASFDYTVEAVASQEDLIAAYVPATSNAAIPLQFGHLLSQVNFAIQQSESFQIEIESITLKGIPNSATYTFGDPGSWSAATGTEEYVYPITATFPTASTNTILSLGTSTNALMLMPQTFSSESAYIEVSLKLLVKNGAANGIDDIYLAGDETNYVTAKACLNNYGTQTWAPCKRYTYLLDFTPSVSDVFITFNVLLDEWTDASPKYLTVEVAQPSKFSIESAIASLAAYGTGHDAIHITVNGAPTANIDLEIPATYTGSKIVIYFKNGLGGNTITATDWTVTATTTNTITLTK